MAWAPIKKSPEDSMVQPNLLDYESLCDTFSWETVRRELDGLPGGMGLNIAYEAVDWHANGWRRDRLALRWLVRDGTVHDFTYGDLQAASNRFAHVLQSLGVAPGERVFVLAGRIPELYVAALGTWKTRGVFCPLFSAFGPEPMYQRLSRGDAKVLVTSRRLYDQKVAALRPRLPMLQHVLVADADEDLSDGVWSLPLRTQAASAEFTIPPTDPEDTAVLHFTSGTTGMPKGAIHVHQAVLTHYMAGKYVLDFHPGQGTSSGLPPTPVG